MIKSASRLVCFVLMSALFGTAAGAAEPAAPKAGQGAPALSLAVVDMDAIGEKAKAVKGLRSQMANYRQKFQGEIQKEEQDLRKADQELARQRAILSPEAFNAERQKFVDRVQTFGRKVDNLKRELAHSESTAMLEVKKKLVTVIAEVAKERGLNLIVRRDSTVLVANALDITNAVLERFDKTMPSVQVPEPKPPAATNNSQPGKPPQTPGK